MKLGANLVKPGKMRFIQEEILDILISRKCLILF